jgi:Origin recognition complex (ORC) subunit 4 C-terminus
MTQLLTLGEAESATAGVSQQYSTAWNAACAKLFRADTTTSTAAARSSGKRKAGATAASPAAAAATGTASALPVLAHFVERGVSYRGLCRLLEIAVARKVTPRSPCLTAAAVRFAAEQIELDLDLQKVQELSELQLLVLVAMIRMARREKGAFTFQGACYATTAHDDNSDCTASTASAISAATSTVLTSSATVLCCN